MNQIHPQRGDQFYHSKWLDPSHGYDKKVPALFEVTSIRSGVVYYRPVYMHGNQKELGKATYCAVSELPKYVLNWKES
jgi:hypothetical protein